jgi:hypothetical protein
MHGAHYFKNSAGWTTSLERKFDILSPYTVRPRSELTPKVDGSRTPLMAVPDPITKQAKCLDSGSKDANAAWRADKDPYDGDYRSQKNGALIAEALCAGCPIKDWCLEDTMAKEGDVNGRNRYGVRGGLTPEGRAELALSRRPCPKAGHVGHMKRYDNSVVCLECKRAEVRERYARSKGDGDAA